MSYVVVAKGTGLIVTDGPRQGRAYKTMGAAEATRSRLIRKQGGVLISSTLWNMLPIVRRRKKFAVL